MLYGGPSAYIMFHGEISELSAYIVFHCEISAFMLPSCCLHVLQSSLCLRAPELAEQSGLALGRIWKALGSFWKALGSVPEASRELLEAS